MQSHFFIQQWHIGIYALWDQTTVNFYPKHKIFLPRKCIWKCCMQNNIRIFVSFQCVKQSEDDLFVSVLSILDSWKNMFINTKHNLNCVKINLQYALCLDILSYWFFPRANKPQLLCCLSKVGLARTHSVFQTLFQLTLVILSFQISTNFFCLFYIFFTLRWHMQSKSLLVRDKEPLMLHIWYNGYWWSGNTRNNQVEPSLMY